MNKGQGAVMDALFFMFICAVASTLMFYVSGLYGQGIDQQISAVYNLEYTGNSLVALHSVNNFRFWNDIRYRVEEDGDENEITGYIDGEDIWGEVLNSSPSRYPFLCFEGGCAVDTPYCYPNEDSDYVYQYEGEDVEEEFFRENFVAYTSSVNLDDGCEAVFKVYY